MFDITSLNLNQMIELRAQLDAAIHEERISQIKTAHYERQLARIYSQMNSGQHVELRKYHRGFEETEEYGSWHEVTPERAAYKTCIFLSSGHCPYEYRIV